MTTNFKGRDVYNVQSVIGGMTTQSWIDKITCNQNAIGAVKIATGEEYSELSDLYALAFITGKFIGVEMQSLE